ncbi:MAG: nucleotidyltransferase domain-containing protein [Candidatus Brocadiaceae bacterium]|nr:nucleotidyltransferase domain-containing protein [Candidatus Brocadiaceae bacterium]
MEVLIAMENNSADSILKELSQTLKKEFGQRIKDIILFGSRARGDSYPESDYDVLVLVDKETKELSDKIFNISCEIGWKHNAIIIVFVHEQSCYEREKYEPLFMNIRKEGVHI